MPLLSLQTSVNVTKQQKDELLAKLSKIVVDVLSKPEKYVMVTFAQADVMMSGTQDPAAFVEIKSIGGLNLEVNCKISQQICSLLKESLGISGDRVYINFTDIARDSWGWDSKTFA